MPNRLKMSKIQSVLALREKGWTYSRIARELGVHRETVARYVQRRENPSITAPEVSEAKPAEAPPGSDNSKPTEAPRRTAERPIGRSDCEPWRAVIEAKLDLALEAKRIHQDLVQEHGFQGSYWSVMRFVRQLGVSSDLPFRRMECAAGEEAQIDFGTGAPVVESSGRRRRTHVFRLVLSYSRKGYSEAVFRQTTEEFLRCIENAFVFFGGSVKTLVIDNLRAAVTKADWYEPELHPKLRSFCEHYGVVVLPTRPYTPRHKGKIESGVKYIKRNALKAREFPSLEAQNEFLRQWEAKVADTRVHGTLKQQVGQRFETAERPALRPLPLERFPCFRERQHTVHRDGHVQVDGAYYSVPTEYYRRTVWVRWDSRLVRIFNQQLEEVRVHIKQSAPGGFSTHPADIAAEKISGMERGTEWLLQRASAIGEHADRWAQEVIRTGGVQGIRTVIGLLGLVDRQPTAQVDKACEIAHSYGAYRLKSIRYLLKHHAPQQEQLAFMHEHPIIRSLDTYGELVRNAFRNSPASSGIDVCSDPTGGDALFSLERTSE